MWGNPKCSLNTCSGENELRCPSPAQMFPRGAWLKCSLLQSSVFQKMLLIANKKIYLLDLPGSAAYSPTPPMLFFFELSVRLFISISYCILHIQVRYVAQPPSPFPLLLFLSKLCHLVFQSHSRITVPYQISVLCQLSCNFDLALSFLAPSIIFVTFYISIEAFRLSIILFALFSFFLQWYFEKNLQGFPFFSAFFLSRPLWVTFIWTLISPAW